MLNNMKFISLLFATVIVASALAGQVAESKLEQLKTLTTQHDGVIEFNATGYKYYTSSPRQYDIVFFLTASNCKLCNDLYVEFREVVRLYQAANCMEVQKDGENELRPVFFGKMTFSDSTRDIFKDIGLKSVPDIFVNRPDFESLPEADKKVYFKKYLWQVMPSDGHVTSQKLLEYINQKEERNVEYKESIFNLLWVIAVLGAIITAGVLLFINFRSFFLNQKVWLFGSYAIYFICMSGVVFNIIHNTQFSGGSGNWYAEGSRSQYVVEGYVMSGSILAAGLLMVLMQFFPRWSDGSKTFTFVAYIGSYFAMNLIIKFIETVYHAKSGFYNPIFNPPAHYIHGPLMRDQGNNI